MSLFGGRSFFGMGVGRRKPGRARRSFAGSEREFVDNEIEIAEATESLPGELVRRTQRSATEDVHWMRRGLFKVGFNSGAPRLKGARKFTK